MPVIKAAAHLHTTESFDGHWTLRDLARSLRRRGYDAMLTAEHCQSLDPDSWRDYQRMCAAASSTDFLVVPGIEYRDADNVVHVPTWGRDLPHLGDRVDVGRLLGEVAAQGGAAVFAHPGRQDAWTRFDESWYPLLSGIEVWNRKYDGLTPSVAGTRLASAHQVASLASLDFHRRRQFAPLATRLVVEARTIDGVVEALRAGRTTPLFLRQPLAAWQTGARRAALSMMDTGRSTTARIVRRLKPDL